MVTYLLAPVTRTVKTAWSSVVFGGTMLCREEVEMQGASTQWWGTKFIRLTMWKFGIVRHYPTQTNAEGKQHASLVLAAESPWRAVLDDHINEFGEEDGWKLQTWHLLQER
jgi:hypothetical protein